MGMYEKNLKPTYQLSNKIYILKLKILKIQEQILKNRCFIRTDLFLWIVISCILL